MVCYLLKCNVRVSNVYNNLIDDETAMCYLTTWSVIRPTLLSRCRHPIRKSRDISYLMVISLLGKD